MAKNGFGKPRTTPIRALELTRSACTRRQGRHSLHKNFCAERRRNPSRKHAKQRNKKPWAASWETKIDPQLIENYFQGLVRCESFFVSNIDVYPLVQDLRERIALTVRQAKTKARPREHTLPLDGCSLLPIAMALLESVRQPTAFYK